jgi:threonine dehydrogenase-like Zn-dependent dehydrogenase
MIAVRLREGAAPELTTVDRPEPGPGEVRLAVSYSGICHTDLHFVAGERAARMASEVTMGHEVVGVIDALGPDVADWAVGDRVLVNPMGERGGQSWVLGVHYDGGWAEHVVVPADMLVAVGNIPPEQAAVIPDAVSTPWAAIRNTADVRAGESAGVWGIGGLGYHGVQLLRLVGAAPIVAVDPNPAARERALRVGADLALDPSRQDLNERILEATDGRGLDVAFDFVGNANVQQQAFDAVGRYGRIVLVGVANGDLTLHSSPVLVRLSKQVIGHYGAERHHLAQVVDLVRHGRLDLSGSVSQILPLAEFERGLDVLRNKVGDPVRVLLRPGGQD